MNEWMNEWMRNLKCTIVPVIIGATGIVTRNLRKNLETLTGKHSIDSLQKTSILGTSHVIWKVLQCEAWSLSSGDHRWFKRSTRKNMATIQNMLGQDCTNPRCYVIWVTKFCVVVPNVNETHIKKRSRITVCTQLYLTCKKSYMFHIYIYSHQQAGCRTLSCLKI